MRNIGLVILCIVLCGLLFWGCGEEIESYGYYLKGGGKYLKLEPVSIENPFKYPRLKSTKDLEMIIYMKDFKPENYEFIYASLPSADKEKHLSPEIFPMKKKDMYQVKFKDQINTGGVFFLIHKTFLFSGKPWAAFIGDPGKEVKKLSENENISARERLSIVQTYIEAEPEEQERFGSNISRLSAEIENEEFSKIKELHSSWEQIRAFESYLGKYPNGNFVDQAKAEIKKIKEKWDDETFAKALNNKNERYRCSYLEQYLKKYQNGRHVDQAKAEIKKIKQRLDDEGKRRYHVVRSGDSKRRYHMVRSGDSPYGIAQKYGISVAELRRLNNLSKKQLIYPGQKLLIAKGSGQ
jgi:hypothetical protein